MGKRFAFAFGSSEADLPPDLMAFERYLERTIGQLEVSADARLLASGILRPPAPAVLAPVSGLTRFITVGLLPPRLRKGFGFAWDPARERAFSAVATSIRGTRAMVPRCWRLWPHALQAECRSVTNIR